MNYYSRISLPLLLAGFLIGLPANAQQFSLPSNNLNGNVSLFSNAQNSGGIPQNNRLVAQANPQVPTPGVLPTDVTPIPLNQEQQLFEPGVKYRLLKKLPDKVWFSSVTETSLRFDTNVFFTYSKPKFDGAFRVLPNVTLGYNVFKRTSVYCNWFLIKDLYMDNAAILNFPTTQSLSLGFRHDIPVGQRTNIQLDFQARELWQTSHLRQADLIPAVNVTHVFTPNVIGFGSVLLQMRGRNYFVAPTRELDPFYTLGVVLRRGNWTLAASDTLVTNFRSPPFHGSIPAQGNCSMIADIELSRPVARSIPNLQVFCRAEPIYNWSSHKVPGLSGFDFRLFGGLRLTMNKPAYDESIENLRKQLIESETEEPNKPTSDANQTEPNKTSSNGEVSLQPLATETSQHADTAILTSASAGN